MSVQAAKGWFTGSATVGGFAEKTESETWTTETEKSTTIQVSSSKTMVTALLLYS